MITEDYVSFEVAKLLKEKGFDEGCDKFYPINGGEVEELTLDELNYHRSEFIKAPTHQMAMKWLREVHNIFILIEPHSYNYIEEKNSSYVFSFWQGDNYCENPLLKEYYSYESTVEASLKYSLENLI